MMNTVVNEMYNFIDIFWVNFVEEKDQTWRRHISRSTVSSKSFQTPG